MGGGAVDHGYKGKGSTIHLITDAKGQPLNVEITSANGDERKQVVQLIDKLQHLLPEELLILEADKGYDSKEVRREAVYRGFYPLIPYRGRGREHNRWVERVRWKVERAISWLKRGYRRVATRWERLKAAYEGIVQMALCYFWVKKIVG
jgi:transposase